MLVGGRTRERGRVGVGDGRESIEIVVGLARQQPSVHAVTEGHALNQWRVRCIGVARRMRALRDRVQARGRIVGITDLV